MKSLYVDIIRKNVIINYMLLPVVLSVLMLLHRISVDAQAGIKSQ